MVRAASPARILFAADEAQRWQPPGHPRRRVTSLAPARSSRAVLTSQTIRLAASSSRCRCALTARARLSLSHCSRALPRLEPLCCPAKSRLSPLRVPGAAILPAPCRLQCAPPATRAP